MSTSQIPPSGMMPQLTATVPPPNGMSQIGGVQIELNWTVLVTRVIPQVLVDGVQYAANPYMQTSTGTIWHCVFPARSAPVEVTIGIDFVAEALAGSTLNVSAQGAQTESGNPPMNLDEPTAFGAAVDFGTLEILSWQEWNRLTGANQGAETGS